MQIVHILARNTTFMIIIIMFNFPQLRKKSNYSVFTKNMDLEREYTFRLWDWVTQEVRK